MIPAGAVQLEGDLVIPARAGGLVLFSALIAAAERVGAIVSRGGRPDLAHAALGRVRAPTLLIVGGEDTTVRGATHLFEEPGALERVARLAGDWFVQSLRPAP